MGRIHRLMTLVQNFPDTWKALVDSHFPAAKQDVNAYKAVDFFHTELKHQFEPKFMTPGSFREYHLLISPLLKTSRWGLFKNDFWTPLWYGELHDGTKYPFYPAEQVFLKMRSFGSWFCRNYSKRSKLLERLSALPVRLKIRNISGRESIIRNFGVDQRVYYNNTKNGVFCRKDLCCLEPVSMAYEPFILPSRLPRHSGPWNFFSSFCTFWQ